METEKGTAICKECGDKLTTRHGSTSSLRYHAEKRHNLVIGNPKKNRALEEDLGNKAYWPY